MNKNILVTGGLGHIGSKLIKKIPPQYNVTVVDNFYTQRYCSLFNINRPIKFIECSFIDTPLEIIQQSDIIIHLAAIVNASGSFNNDDIGKVNIQQTKQFIDMCDNRRDIKFLFPSSTSVYGTASSVVTEDDDTLLNPQSPYAESKIEIEKYLQSKRMKYIIMRLGTVFGNSPGMRFHTAVNKFCYQAATGLPLTIWKQNYHQYRPYLDINDCIQAIQLFIDKGIYGSTFNVTTNNYQLSEIVNYIQSINPVKVEMIDTPLLNQYSYKTDNSKLCSIGFQPKGDLFAAIEATMEKLKCLNAY